jgi:putative ABC transport system permease protein
MTSFLGDLRLALRSFLRAPGFAMVAVLTLALGIGVNTAIFSVVDGVMLRPLPTPTPTSGPPAAHAQRRKERLGLVSQLRRLAATEPFVHPARRLPPRLGGAHRLRPAAQPHRRGGHRQPLRDARRGPEPRPGFAAGEDTQGRNHVAVLSDRGWRRAFAGDPAILGRTISIDHTPFTVVGIMPASFRFVLDNADIDLFVPMPRAFDLALANERDGHYLTTVGRLAPGVSPEQVSAELQAMAVAHPESNADRAVRAWPLKDKLTATVRPALLVLVGAVAFILLIACANVANLLLARAGVRQHELAVRLALGATRGRLMRQLLTESVLLAVLGAGAGLLLALWSLDALKSFMPTEIARYRELGVDARVLGFTFLVALATGVVFGLVPALQLSGHAPWTVLKDSGGRTATAQPSRRRARNAFVVAEVAVATVLLVGAALMLRSFQRVVTVDPGFRPEELVTASIALPDARYDDEVTWARFYRELLPRLEALPGVEGVALGLPIPFTGTNLGVSYAIPGQPDENQGAPLHLVNPGWFSTLGIAVKAGRPFGAADDAPGAERVAMISENLARRHFGSAGAAIGKSIAIGWGDGAPLRIVGVAADVREKTLEKDPDTATYMPFTQSSFSTLNIAGADPRPGRHGRGGARHRRRGRPRPAGVERVDDARHHGRLAARAPHEHAAPGDLRRAGLAARPRGRLRRHVVQRDPAGRGDRDPHGARGAARRRGAHGRRPGRAARGRRRRAGRDRGAGPVASPRRVALGRELHRSADLRRDGRTLRDGGGAGELAARPPRRARGADVGAARRVAPQRRSDQTVPFQTQVSPR